MMIALVWYAQKRYQAIAYTTAVLPDDGDAVFFLRVGSTLSSSRFVMVARHARR